MGTDSRQSLDKLTLSLAQDLQNLIKIERMIKEDQTSGNLLSETEQHNSSYSVPRNNTALGVARRELFNQCVAKMCTLTQATEPDIKEKMRFLFRKIINKVK